MKCNPSIINRIKRVEGQIKGVLNMIAEERNCNDLTTQLKAIESSVRKAITLLAIDNLKEQVLKEHNIDITEFTEEIDLLVNR